MYFDCSCWISSISSRSSTRASRSRPKPIVSSLFAVTENLPVSTILFAENTDSHLAVSLPTRHVRLTDTAIIAEFAYPSYFPTDSEAASRPVRPPRGESAIGIHSPPKHLQVISIFCIGTHIVFMIH